MVTTITIIVILALVIGVALGLLASGDDQQKLLVAQIELGDLRKALIVNRLEIIQQRMRYEKRISSAYEVISNYEAILDEQEQQKPPIKSAVILPFKSY